MSKNKANGVATEVTGIGPAAGRLDTPKPPEAKAKPGIIVIPAPDFRVLPIKVIGLKPLICNAFPDKTLRQWEDERSREVKPGEKQKKQRPVRNYEQEFQASLYPLSDGSGYGFPSVTFKRAMVAACRNVDGLPMTNANRWIYVCADDYSKGCDVVKIHGKPTMRRDMVRLNDMNRTADIRFRGQFEQWWCLLRIEFNASELSPASIINLLQWAGKTEGVGEMRPSAPKKPFDFGTFYPAVEGA
jgi:hypothetical protein